MPLPQRRPQTLATTMPDTGKVGHSGSPWRLHRILALYVLKTWIGVSLFEDMHFEDIITSIKGAMGFAKES